MIIDSIGRFAAMMIGNGRHLFCTGVGIRNGCSNDMVVIGMIGAVIVVGRKYDHSFQLVLIGVGAGNYYYTTKQTQKNTNQINTDTNLHNIIILFLCFVLLL